MRSVSEFIQDECGAQSIEYSLMATLIAVAIVVALGTVGTSLSTTFSSVTASL